MSESNLSDKRVPNSDISLISFEVYREDYVREFIRDVNNDMMKQHDWGVNHGNTKGLIPISVVKKIIRERAGSKLVDSPHPEGDREVPEAIGSTNSCGGIDVKASADTQTQKGGDVCENCGYFYQFHEESGQGYATDACKKFKPKEVCNSHKKTMWGRVHCDKCKPKEVDDE